MITYIRILLHVIAGMLLTSGYINEEIKSLIVDDPAVANSVQLAVAAVAHGAALLWWRLAKRMGWKT